MFRDVYSFYRIGRYMHIKKYKIAEAICNIFKRLIFPSCDIPFSANIGSGTRFPHRAIGVIIHEDAIIGKECKIENNVVIGGRNSLGSPILGNYCFVGNGAKILGGVTVGNDCMIGAGTIILKDVPDASVVVGVPGKIIKNTAKNLIGRRKE